LGEVFGDAFAESSPLAIGKKRMAIALIMDVTVIGTRLAVKSAFFRAVDLG
jgi:hypothetical protein